MCVYVKFSPEGVVRLQFSKCSLKECFRYLVTPLKVLTGTQDSPPSLFFLTLNLHFSEDFRTSLCGVSWSIPSSLIFRNEQQTHRCELYTKHKYKMYKVVNCLSTNTAHGYVFYRFSIQRKRCLYFLSRQKYTKWNVHLHKAVSKAASYARLHRWEVTTQSLSLS